MLLTATPSASDRVHEAFAKRVSCPSEPFHPSSSPLLATAAFSAPLGAWRCIASISRLKLSFSSGRKSNLAKAASEYKERETGTFIWAFRKLVAAAHCAAVAGAVQFDGSTAVPAGLLINGFAMRLSPSELPSVTSRFENQ